jgi:hypothetical protein
MIGALHAADGVCHWSLGYDARASDNKHVLSWFAVVGGGGGFICLFQISAPATNARRRALVIYAAVRYPL